jgi:translocation and assembly module TamB
MTRPQRIGLIIAGSLVGLVVIVLIAAIIIVRTDRFRNFVRAKLVDEIQQATGGTATVGSFDFAWQHLRADVHDLVLHGLEGPDRAPLLRVAHLQVDLKLLSPLRGFIDIAYLLAETPQANIIVYPDGHTNIPAPKIKSTSNKSGLQTIIDLAIGHFDLRNGSATFGERKTDWNASGRELRVQMGYARLPAPHYMGEVDWTVNVASGKNAPVDAAIKLPVTLEGDKVTLTNGEVRTPESHVVISASMDHMNAPRTSARVNAQIALDEVRRAAGLTVPLDTAHAPRFADADIAASIDENTRVQIQSARVTYGHSNLEASGALQGAVRFNASLAIDEIGRLLRVAARPEGAVRIGGNATLRPNNEYLVTANLDARGVALTASGTRIAGVDLDSSVTADPRRIELGGLRLQALGGSFSGSAGIENMAQLHVSGDLRNFDIDRATRVVMKQGLGYDGVLSGPVQASGNLKNTAELVARANLQIAPGPRGVPVSGHLGVDYNARADSVTLARSYLNLPHTRIDLSGELNRQIQARVVSRDLRDFRPVAPNLPIQIQPGGAATVNVTISGQLSAPRIGAEALLMNFSADGRAFARLSADLAASKTGASVSDGTLSHGALQAEFSGAVGLRDWKPEQYEPLRLDATVRNADLADVLALAGESNVRATGGLTADAHITGTVGSPQGNADLLVTNGTMEGERFDSLTARAVMTDRSIDVPALTWRAGASRIDANATYQHAVNDLARGSLRAHVASNQVQLAQFQSLVKDRSGLAGLLTLNADAAANVIPVKTGSDFEITSLNANLAARNLQMEGKNLGDFTATANTAGNALRYDVNSNFAGSTIHVNGQSLLAGNHETTASAQIANLPIDRVLAIAGQHDVPVNGVLSANAQLSGTLQDPHATGSATIVKGSAFQEPFDRLQASFTYAPTLIDVSSLRIDDGPSSIEASGSLSHPAGNFQDGQARFRVRSNDIQLARIHTLQQSRPGLAGVLQITADGAVTLRKNAGPLFSTLDADIAARGLTVDRKALGDLNATAHTQGNEIAFNLNSDLGHADIHGNGRMQLGSDYPLTASLNFRNLTYTGLSPLIGGTSQPFGATVDGAVNVSGPISRTEDLRATVDLSKVEAHSVPASTGRKPRVNLDIHNAGPIDLVLDRSVVTIRSAHLTGPLTDINVTGTATIAGAKAVNLRANGNVKLDILEAFDPDVFSAGNVVLNASLTGTLDQPSVSGQLQLQNASFNETSLPNGLSNANGTIAFNGREAVIQNLTGETGGGKLTLTGYAAFGGPELQFQIQASADRVRVEQPQDFTTMANAKLTLAGTTSRSLLSGTVTIQEIAMHSHSDVGSVLAQAATPPVTPTTSTGLAAGIRFDVRVVTATGVRFRSTLTQNLQADANLTLRGTVDNPGMLGRIVVTQGQMVFFNYKYNVEQGTIAFYNPNRIAPVLNIDLSTTAQGVDVSLSVSGPVDKMKLTYRSDPPMQFNDLVSLLATGRLNTTDPVLAMRQPPALDQNLEQTGASALLGSAVANPVSGRLQRLFGVSALKIDPQLVGTSNTPQATLTLQQQITREITFTYIQDVTASNPQIIRVEWAVNPQWSAVAQRDQFGVFDLDFFYKKRFH